MTKQTNPETAQGKLDDTQLDAAVGGITDSSIIPCFKTVSGIIPCIKTPRTVTPCFKTQKSP